MSNLEYALQQARKIPYVKGQARHYALVLDSKDRIISESANSYTRTHTAMHKASRKLGLLKDYAHAELLAIVKSRGRGCKLLVVRVLADGSKANSEPCLVCKEILRNSHIESVEYST
jgi:tRNA(Arg) A34 adenosine deaminase TadA